MARPDQRPGQAASTCQRQGRAGHDGRDRRPGRQGGLQRRPHADVVGRAGGGDVIVGDRRQEDQRRRRRRQRDRRQAARRHRRRSSTTAATTSTRRRSSSASGRSSSTARAPAVAAGGGRLPSSRSVARAAYLGGVTRVKICGITRPGGRPAGSPSWAPGRSGMIFWPESPRACTLETAEAIGAELQRQARAGRRVRERHAGRGGRRGRPLPPDAWSSCTATRGRPTAARSRGAPAPR